VKTAAPAAQRTVLAVEDSPVQLKIVTRYVEQGLDCRVVSADSVEAAVQSLLHEVPDLIISDLMMRPLDGLDFVQILAVDDAWRTIPIVIHSAANHLTGIRALSECGVKGYILKPFDPDVVLPRLSRVLAAHPPRTEHRRASAPVAEGRVPILVVTRRPELAGVIARTVGRLYEVVTVDSGPAAVVRMLEIRPWLVFVCPDVGRWTADKTRRGLLALRTVPRVRVVELPDQDEKALAAAVVDNVGEGPFTSHDGPTLTVRVRDTFTTGCLGALRTVLEERVAHGVSRIVFEIPYESMESAALSGVTALARQYRR
jgi:CheY-like chemotaxis protein